MVGYQATPVPVPADSSGVVAGLTKIFKPHETLAQAKNYVFAHGNISLLAKMLATSNSSRFIRQSLPVHVPASEYFLKSIAKSRAPGTAAIVETGHSLVARTYGGAASAHCHLNDPLQFLGIGQCLDNQSLARHLQVFLGLFPESYHLTGHINVPLPAKIQCLEFRFRFRFRFQEP